jgi:hypothetical protein
MHVTNIAGATNSSFTITNAGATNTSPTVYYQVLATNASGAVSNTVGLFLKAPPMLGTHPTNSLTVATNATISLAAALTNGNGVGTVYSWKKDGKSISTPAFLGMTNGQTNILLTINNAAVSNSGVYSLVVSNATGSAVSSNATVLVVAGPSIKTQPTNVFVTSGATKGFGLSIVMNNATNSALVYNWYTNSSSAALTNGTGADGLVVSGATNFVLYVTNLAASTNRYYVVVTNLAGAKTSYTSVVTVLDPVVINSVTMTNVTSSATNDFSNMSITNVMAVGTSNIFNVDAAGSDVRYQWYKNGTLLSRKTNSTLILPKLAATDSGTYTVKVTNRVSSVTSSNIMLLVVPTPGIRTDLVGTNLIRGTNYTLTVVASNAATSALKYLWQKDSVTVLDWSTNSSLTLTNVQPTTNGDYTVVLSNATTVSSSLWKTSRIAKITVLDRLSISNQPTNITAIVGLNYTNAVTLSNGTYGTISYVWTRAGSTNVPSTSGTLAITNAQTTNSGTYYVTISNLVSKVVSSNAVINFFTNPVFTTSMSNAVVAAGSNYTMKVVVSGATNSAMGLRYKWYRNSIVVEGAFTNTLTLTSASTNNSGTYTVVVTNVLGLAATNSATITVLTKAVIVTQPSSPNVTNGASFSLAVVATGDNLVYQWRKAQNSTTFTNIPGATGPTYTVSSATTKDAGGYNVVVSNLVNSVTSSKASVVVVFNGKSYKDNASAIGAAGDYTGLFVATNGVPTYQSAGMLSLSVATSGAYSGKILLEGDVINVSGQLDANGTAQAQIARSGKALLTLKLVADNDNKQLTGSVSASNWVSALTADLAVFSATNPAPWAGSYSLVIPATDPTNGLSGSGKVLVKPAGSIAFVGTSSEGKAISQSSAVSQEGYWPFYLPYGEGEIIGWLQFVDGKLVGTLNWIDSTGEDSILSEAVGTSYTE